MILELRRSNKEMEEMIVDLKERIQTVESERNSLMDEVEEDKKTICQLTQRTEETPKEETPKEEMPKVETPKEEASEPTNPVTETPKSETPIAETPTEEPVSAAAPSADSEAAAVPTQEGSETEIPENRVDSQIGNNVLLNVLRDTSEESL